MVIDYNREKLMNAIVFFVRNTKHCHTLKLFKLLSFLDFEHYRQTGRPVTNLTYQALPKGPVPCELFETIKSGKGDLFDFIKINEIKDELSGQLLLREIKAKKKFDDKYFTTRELEIMERISLFFKELKAEDMSEFSHDPKMPWTKVFKKGEGTGETIPFELAFSSTPIVKEENTIEPDELEFLKQA